MRVERIGKATLYCGDCLDILPEVPAFGHVVTDPPYMLKSSSDHKSKLNPWNDLCNGAVFVSQWLKLCADRMENGGALWSFCNWRGLPPDRRGGAGDHRSRHPPLAPDGISGKAVGITKSPS